MSLPASAGAASAGAAWTRPAEIAAPTAISVVGPQIASSTTGAAAVAFNEVNVDAQAIGAAFLALAPPHGGFGGAQQVPGTQEILAVAFSGRTLDLLVASGPPGQACCSQAQIIRRGPSSRFGPPRTLVTGVGGGATGRLVPLENGRMLAVIAGPERLWVSEAGRSGRFGAARGLTPTGVAPAALAVTGTDGGGAMLAWTQGGGQGRVVAASAGPGATPSRARVLFSLAAGHTVDGLQLVPRPGGVTLAWTESHSDGVGGYHARAMAADLTGAGRRGRVRALSAPTEVASALAVAGDGTGDEVAAWNACPTGTDACVVKSAVRMGSGTRRGRSRRGRAARAGARWFGPARSIGEIDAGQSPQLTMAPDRASLLGWITGHRVVLAGMPPSATRFGAPGAMSGDFADNLALGFGPTGQAVAMWTQGTFATAVLATVAR